MEARDKGKRIDLTLESDVGHNSWQYIVELHIMESCAGSLKEISHKCDSPALSPHSSLSRIHPNPF